MASTRLPGKPLADIGGVPMIVRVMRRAAGRRGRAGRGRDRLRRNRRRRDGGRRARRDGSRRSRVGLGPHLRGPGARRSARARRDRRQRAGRLSDARSRRHPPGARSARRSGGRHRDARDGDHRGGRAHRSERRQGDLLAGGAGPLPRALFHPRDRAERRGAALSSHRALRLSPRGARALRGAAAVDRWNGASGSSSCARWKTACASTSRSRAT